MSKITKQPQAGPAGKSSGSLVFSCLQDLLSYHRRIAPGRNAILAPNYDPITYTALWHSADAVRHELRSLGIGQADRVAVVLPNGPEAVVATLAVASAAVCAPLNPSFAADEWHRYFGDLQVAALLTRRDMQSASRGVAHALGIPVSIFCHGATKDWALLAFRLRVRAAASPMTCRQLAAMMPLFC